MSYYFRDKPRFSDRPRGNSGSDDLMESLKRQFDQDSKLFFEPTSSHRSSREREHPFDHRHIGFPRGFPFDDDGFDRRGNIRSHLDDLAARHPEFADHLLGPPWGDAPFLGTPRNRRRGSGLGGGYQGHPDDDARSQASGSSATSAASAASGASGVSSHCEADGSCEGQDPHVSSRDQEQRHEDGRTSNPIPQYGLRNTVDIGQHRHNMENNEKLNRGQRSASAPPENRQKESQYPQQEQQSQSPNQRFVSRVDITPQQQQQHGDATKPTMQSKQPQQSPPPPPQSSQQQKGQQKGPQQQQHSNVRHIPIFVEGRDEPVIPRNVEEPTFAQPQQQQRPQSPPQFHRPSHFNQHFANNRQQQWPPQYHHPQQQFYQQPHHEQHVPAQPQAQKPNPYQQQQQQYRQQQAEKQRAQQQQQPQQQQHEEETAEPPKLKQIQPKEPLERVALVQQEVNSLMEQVKLFSGDSRQAKDYMYLDEMLTRELIKLDDIETEGKPEVRQARKDAIKSIQECIALLESKVPLPGQEEEPAKTIEEEGEKQISLPMETDVASVPATETPEAPPQASQTAPIPLPAAPVLEQNLPNEKERTAPDLEPKLAEAVPLEKANSVTAMETQQDAEGNKTEAAAPPPASTDPTENSNDNSEQQMDVDAAKATKSPRKGRKTKMPTPVSEEPIPLPAPEASSHT